MSPLGGSRGRETIRAGLRAAETGQLVLATLHTNDAIQTVDRIVDVFPAGSQQQVRFQLSMVLLAIISQRLLPRADVEGRVLAVELLKDTHAVANRIRQGKTHQVQSAMETGRKEGMIIMDKSLKELYLEGLISYDEARESIGNPKELK